MKNKLKEIWMDITGYKGLYQVSNHGGVRSLDRYVQWKNTLSFRRGKRIKILKDKDGYMFVVLTKDKRRKHFKVHRLVLTAFDRPPKHKEQCNHKDGNKQNNCIENLEWVTSKQNINHAIHILGVRLGIVGERHGRAVLNNSGVKEIKILLKEGKITQSEIANKYNISRSVIRDINIGKTWCNVKV